MAVDAKEIVIAVFELQLARKRIKQSEGALGSKTLESDILKEPVDFAKAKKCIARSPALPSALKAVCQDLGLSRSHLAAKHRASECRDGRKYVPLADYDTLKQSIFRLVKYQTTYVNRRVWPRLRMAGHWVKCKRVYRMKRDEGLLQFR